MKKNLISAALCTIIMCATTSCASIFCGSKAKVTFDSYIKENVTLTIDDIKHNGVAFLLSNITHRSIRVPFCHQSGAATAAITTKH